MPLTNALDIIEKLQQEKKFDISLTNHGFGWKVKFTRFCHQSQPDNELAFGLGNTLLEAIERCS